MAHIGSYRDNGKENGNYCSGFCVAPLRRIINVWEHIFGNTRAHAQLYTLQQRS